VNGLAATPTYSAPLIELFEIADIEDRDDLRRRYQTWAGENRNHDDLVAVFTPLREQKVFAIDLMVANLITAIGVVAEAQIASEAARSNSEVKPKRVERVEAAQKLEVVATPEETAERATHKPPTSDGDSKAEPPKPKTLLDEVVAFVRSYIVLPADYLYDGVALWILHAHAIDAFDITPRLAIRSAEKESGKSKLLQVLEVLVPNAVSTVNISTAALFRVIDQEKPTILFDEVDSVFTATKSDPGQEELRGLLNAGYQRGTGVWRVQMPSGKVTKREVFAPVALACIGTLPDTLQSRSITIPMRRKLSNEKITSFRVREVTEQAAELVERLAVWAKKNEAKLRAARPKMPDGVDDRAADCWEPLLAIADLFGPEWATRARLAAQEIVASRLAEDDSEGVRLLVAIRAVFTEDYSAMHSMELVTRLNDYEEGGYKSWNGTKGIFPTDVAKILKRYDIRPKDVRAGNANVNKKGYQRAWFRDAWERYAS
jgi:hypothetical protein